MATPVTHPVHQVYKEAKKFIRRFDAFNDHPTPATARTLQETLNALQDALVTAAEASADDEVSSA